METTTTTTTKTAVVLWRPDKILFSKRVQEMDVATELAYRRALDVFYLEGSLPADAALLSVKIGKGCTVETAERIKEMFVLDRRYVGVLKHDFVNIMPEDEQVIPEVDPQEETKIKKFLLLKQLIKGSTMYLESCMQLRRLLPDELNQIIDEFFFAKIIDKEFLKYQSAECESSLRKHIYNFIPYSEHYKKSHGNESASNTNGQFPTSKKFTGRERGSAESTLGW